MFSKTLDNADTIATDYQSMQILPDIKTAKYSIYVHSHHVDIIYQSVVYSMSHLCLPYNSCIQLALDFIDSLNKQKCKDQKQLSLF